MWQDLVNRLIERGQFYTRNENKRCLVSVVFIDSNRSTHLVTMSTEESREKIQALLEVGAGPVAFWVLPVDASQFVPTSEGGAFSVDDQAIINALLDAYCFGPEYKSIMGVDPSELAGGQN